MTNLIPAHIIKKIATAPTNINAALTRLLKTTGMQLREATPFLSTQLPQFDACTGKGNAKRKRKTKNGAMINNFFSI